MACSKGSKCKLTEASIYNREVILKQLKRGTRGTSGGYDAPVYEETRVIWCKIKSVRGFERLFTERLNEVVDKRFECQYDNVADLVAATDRNEWKVSFEGIDYNISHVIDVDDMHQTVEIYAQLGVAG